MDISTTTAPKSDQQNFDDYISGPRTVTIEQVTPGSAEQPVDIHLVEFPGRPFRPSKSMRRVLMAAWGKDTDPYAGRRMTLYGDPEVKFGGQKVGGIRISHLSHIDREMTFALTETKAKRKPFTVQPLKESAPPPRPDFAALVKAATTDDECRGIWKQAAGAGALTDDLKAAITARVGELEKADEPEPDDGFLPTQDADQ